LFQDSTNTNERVNVFDFSSLDLGKSMFASEDHTQILMQADNLLQATKHQLLDLQMTMPFEGKQFRAENRLSESSLSRLVHSHYNVPLCLNICCVINLVIVVARWIRIHFIVVEFLI
jgi:hypothetical protein